MTAHLARVVWELGPDDDFASGRYRRHHRWIFDGGLEVPASASPQIVPLPWSEAAAVDPEEAFVASLSSCHMLWFLSIAADHGFVVRRYADDARGRLGKNAAGQLAIVSVALAPAVSFVGASIPNRDQYEDFHHQAHARCFLAASVTAEVTCLPSIATD